MWNGARYSSLGTTLLLLKASVNLVHSFSYRGVIVAILQLNQVPPSTFEVFRDEERERFFYFFLFYRASYSRLKVSYADWLPNPLIIAQLRAEVARIFSFLFFVFGVPRAVWSKIMWHDLRLRGNNVTELIYTREKVCRMLRYYFTAGKLSVGNKNLHLKYSRLDWMNWIFMEIEDLTLLHRWSYSG